MTAPEQDVLIIGGGVGGLAAANALAARGMSCTVIERARKVGEVDRGDVIHGPMLRLFEAWKIAARLEQYHPLDLSRFRILDDSGATLFELDARRHLPGGGTSFRALRHPDIERFLADAALATGRVQLLRGLACTGLALDGGRVIGAETSQGTLRAPLTVVATGSRSRLLASFGPRPEHDYGLQFLNLRCRQLDAFRDQAAYVLGPRGVMVMVPLPGDQMRIGLQYRTRSPDFDPAPEALRVELLVRLRTFPLAELEVLDQCRYRLTRSLAPSFWRPGAVLLGDAAHTTHPVGGQGMNMAFQDAEALAESLSAACPGSAGSADAAAREYAERRRREVLPVLRRTHLMGLLGAVDNGLYVRLRELALRAANRMPRAKRLVLQRITEVR